MEELLNKESTDFMFKAFVCMRYWHPRANEMVRQVQEYSPQRIVLLSLYPQYSTTTIESSIREWRQRVASEFSGVKTDAIECYPTLDGFVKTAALETLKVMAACEQRAAGGDDFRVLFSAHGLPQKIVDQGDPYRQQVEETVMAIRAEIGRPIDAKICYQSRVGPMRWLAPSTEDEIVRAGKEGKAVILVPVSFVSEHSETLYELDIMYKDLADQSGVPNFTRVPTVGCAAAFIEGLAGLVNPKRTLVKETKHA